MKKQNDTEIGKGKKKSVTGEKTDEIATIINSDGALIKTTKKRGKGLITKQDGNKFSKDNQPDPNLKKEGWKKLRAQRLLTQSIVKMMVGEEGLATDTFKGFLQSLATNAKKGNAKAIEVIVKAMEDEVQKIAMTDAEGNDKDFIMRIGKVDL